MEKRNKTSPPRPLFSLDFWDTFWYWWEKSPSSWSAYHYLQISGTVSAGNSREPQKAQQAHPAPSQRCVHWSKTPTQWNVYSLNSHSSAAGIRVIVSSSKDKQGLEPFAGQFHLPAGKHLMFIELQLVLKCWCSQWGSDHLALTDISRWSQII